MSAVSTPTLPHEVILPIKPPAKIPRGPRFIATRKPLLEAIAMAVSVVKSRTPKPILLCVHIETDDGALVVRAADLELSVRVIVTFAQIKSQGKCCVNAEKLHDVLSRSTADTVTIDARDAISMIVTEPMVNVASRRDAAGQSENDSESRMPLSDPNDFPPSPDEGEVAAETTMPLAALTDTLKRAMLFTQKDSSVHRGILLELEPKKITIVATDGRRMYWDHGSVNATGTAWAILPTNAISKIPKMSGDEIKIALAPSRATFSSGDVLVSTNLIEGQFPPYRDILPDTDKTFSVSREGFVDALRKAEVFCTEESRAAKFELSPMRCVITTSTNAGGAVVRLPGKYQGSHLTIGLKSQFVLDCLAGAADEVNVHFAAPNRPIIIRDKTNAVCIVMPMNLAQ